MSGIPNVNIGIGNILRDFYAEDETDAIALRRAQEQRDAEAEKARAMRSVHALFGGRNEGAAPRRPDAVERLNEERALRDSQRAARTQAREQSEGAASLAAYLQRQGVSPEDAQVMARNPRLVQSWDAGRTRKEEREFRAGESEKDRALREREGARNRANQRSLFGQRQDFEREQAAAKSSAAGSKRGHLPSTVATSMGDFKTAADAISRLEESHKAKIGRGSALTQFIPGTDAKQYDDERRVVAQQFGLIMEGGKLAEADLPRYMAMLPDPADSPERARNKLAVVRRELAEKRRNQVEALSAGGYDMSAFDGSAPTGAAPQPALSPDDQAAYDWATENPHDPRAAAILERLGVE